MSAVQFVTTAPAVQSVSRTMPLVRSPLRQNVMEALDGLALLSDWADSACAYWMERDLAWAAVHQLPA